jgi:uncharacterized glyoxalase superfamily protein PhnB
MQFTPYLYFRGDCESALNFYENCGLGRIQEIRRYEGTPMTERAGLLGGIAFGVRGTGASTVRLRWTGFGTDERMRSINRE